MNEEFLNLLDLVPDGLKPNEDVEKICPRCKSKLIISKASNGHLWIVCEKEGVLICQ